ncbi:hypothetical protein MBLNU457_g0547t1 [Dothideomycetes sp. NU457]
MKNSHDASHYAQMPFTNGANVSFGSQSSQGHTGHYPLPPSHASQQSPLKGFNGVHPQIARFSSFENKPQIYTAVYSGVSVYEMEVNNVACMRRRTDGWLNATQILKVAGVDKGKRTKVLEKEILTGEHEKVQGGYGKYQGTWISYARGREFCRQYGVEDALRPLLEYDLDNDGANPSGNSQDTPTKEQAMAANRKRFYNQSMEQREPQSVGHGTFFSNISPMSSVALTAMQKAAKLNSPAPRQAARPSAGQHSMMADHHTGDMPDSGYGTQNGIAHDQEPPRKRMRQDDSRMSQPGLPMDVSMQSGTPTEVNESFMYSQQQYEDAFVHNSDEPITMPPLPAPDTIEAEEKRALLLDLFADQARLDYSGHPAITQLSAEDYNIPLDASANTALHWAATLARTSLVRLLLQKGANMWRGNAAGQSALISAVLVNNCWEHSCFPDMLEHLSPLIEARDAQGRTILHHVAVACGIKGRAPSSKYYLEALLEFLVRSVTQASGSSTNAVLANMGQAGDDSNQMQSSKGPMSLMRFLSTIVNAQDKGGNTALNLVARIGNRSIIQQLLEIKADPSIPNHKGVSARDFGVGVEDNDWTLNGLSFSQSQINHDTTLPTLDDPTIVNDTSADATNHSNPIDDQNEDFIASLTSLLTQNLAQHKTLLAQKAAQIDALNTQIKELSAQAKLEMDHYQTLQRRARARDERSKKTENLRRILASTSSSHPSSSPKKQATVGDADAPFNGPSPSTSRLHQLIHAYERNNASLVQKSEDLKSRSHELEQQYRRVVALCTNVPESKVEDTLGSLVAAIESERGALATGREDVGRVREFLAMVEGVNGSPHTATANTLGKGLSLGLGPGMVEV